MIIGAHMVITSTNPKADHAFLREVLKLPHVDDSGYLIFGLPPSEVSVHQADKNAVHELFLMCDDVPGGGKLSVYEPRHARPQGEAPKRKMRGKK